MNKCECIKIYCSIIKTGMEHHYMLYMHLGFSVSRYLFRNNTIMTQLLEIVTTHRVNCVAHSSKTLCRAGRMSIIYNVHSIVTLMTSG